MIYDIQTDNESFIEICQTLKEVGVDNYLFPLTLYDKTLQGVHLYDSKNNSLEKTLSLEMQARIQREIRINVWYFLREVILIPESGGKTRYKANRANIALTFCLTNNISSIELLPRQNGKTIGVECIMLWIYHFATINTEMMFSNKQLADSQLNIKRFNDITENLPKFLKSHLDSKLDIDNLGKVSCAANNNTITALSSPRDTAAADKLG